jgi:hypothetical protein
MLMKAKLIPNHYSKAHFHLVSVWVFVSDFSQSWNIRNRVSYFTNICANTTLCDCSYNVNNVGYMFKTLAAVIVWYFYCLLSRTNIPNDSETVSWVVSHSYCVSGLTNWMSFTQKLKLRTNVTLHVTSSQNLKIPECCRFWEWKCQYILHYHNMVF